MADVVSFTDVCEIQGGTQPPKSQFIEEPKDGYVRLLQIRDFKNDEKAVFVPDRTSLKKCREDDVLIARYGASIGRILSGKSGAYNVALAKTIPDEARLDKRFFFHLLCGPSFQDFILNVGSRAAQAGFNKEDLSRFSFVLPSLEEQRRAAAILDKADAIRRKRQEVLTLADDFLRSTFLDMFGDPVANPNGWKTVRLGDLTSDVRYGTSQKCTDTPTGLPVLRIPNILDGAVSWKELKYTELSPKEVLRIKLEIGDLLFVRTNGNPSNIGRCATFSSKRDSLYASYLIRVRLKHNSCLLPDFIRSAVSMPSFRAEIRKKATTTAGNYNINSEAIKNFRLPVPTISEQRKFLNIQESMQDILGKTQMALRLDQSLFASLSQRAFRGEL